MLMRFVYALIVAAALAPAAQAQDGAAVFQLDSILTVRIYFPYPAWRDTLTANYASQRKVPCTFIALGDTLYDVGVRYKGNSSYGLASGSKKSLKLDFNEFVSGQRWDDLKAVNLNNSFKDPTLMREVLMYGYVNQEGCIAPRAAYANVYINDELRGLYVSVEEPDVSEFLNHHFGDAGGNLYKGDPNGTLQWLGADTNQYRTRYEKHTNEEADDWSDLMHFIDRLNNTTAADLPDSVEPLLDVPSLLRFVAVNTLFVNLDSYQGTGHNYYLYNRPDSRFEMIPWDLNEAFGNFNFGMSANTIKNLDVFYLNNPPTRPLFNRLWQTQFMKDMVLVHLWDNLRQPWSPTAMNATIDALYALIQPSVAADTCKQFSTAQFETNINSDIPGQPPGTTIIGLRPFVTTRTTSVNSQVTTQLGTHNLLINELLPLNTGTNADEFGDFDDWVEIHNRGAGSVSLSGYSLTDDYNLPLRFTFPDISIPAGGYLLVWCDGESGEGALHTSFTLDAHGEALFLFSGSGARIADHVLYDSMTTDIAYARAPTALYPWLRVAPTPAAANSDNIPPQVSLVARSPQAPHANDAVWISARLADPDGTIAAATLAYDAGSGYQNLTLLDDGAHGDSAAGDGRFGAQIPGQPSLTVVSYYVECADNEGAVSRYPADAPVSALAYQVDRPPPALVINEFMAQNNSTIQDEEGRWEDWVELYNAGSTAVELGGFSLTDTYSNLTKWVFPDTAISAGGFLLIWCDEDGNDPGLHASFKLSASGEQIALCDAADYGGAVLDSVTFGAQSADISSARACNGDGSFGFDATPTPGASNGICIPAGLTIYSSAGDVTLRWQASAGVTQYHVYRLAQAEDPLESGTLVTTVSGTSVTLNGEVAAQTIAFYVVTAVLD